MNRLTNGLTLTAAGLVLGAGLAACGAHSSTGASAAPSAKAKVSAAAANPTVRADASQAVTDAKACFPKGQTKTGAENCLKNKVPPAQRSALASCLGSAYAHDQGWTHAGWVAFKTTGAQPCVTTALNAAHK